MVNALRHAAPCDEVTSDPVSARNELSGVAQMPDSVLPMRVHVVLGVRR